MAIERGERLESPVAEAELGMELFFSDTRRLGGKLRTVAEDFMVEEIPATLPTSENGPWTAFIIKSRNWETHRLAGVLGSVLRVGRDRVRFAGTKDKRAVTSQQMTAPVPPDALNGITLKDLEIVSKQRVARSIKMGELRGNRFDITARGLELCGEELSSTVQETAESLKELGGFYNYFGVQRFGSMRPITHLVGKKIIDGDVEGAVMMFLGNPLPTDPTEEREARYLIENERDFCRWARELPTHLGLERGLCRKLAEAPKDFLGALKVMPRTLQLMFVHSYQSYLFNMTLSRRVRNGLPMNDVVEGDIVLPVDRDGIADQSSPVEVGPGNLSRIVQQVKKGRCAPTAPLFGVETPLARGDAGEVERAVLDDAQVEAKDFIIHELPRLTTNGTRRVLLGPVRDFHWETGSCKEAVARFRFSLPPGTYATSLLREFLKTDIRNY